MLPLRLIKFAALLLITLSFAGAGLSRARALANFDDPTAARTNISNQASATYSDDEGNAYDTKSETVTITVLAVSAVVVTPDETESSALVGPNEHIVRVFRICNPGNTPDTYTITRAASSTPAEITALYFDVDGNSTLSDGDIPFNVGREASPQIAPRGCIGVLAVVETHNVTAGSQLLLNLTARSNLQSGANAAATDDGTIINSVGAGARLTHPSDPTLQPLKLVEDKERTVGHVGQSLNYSISFRNSGDVVARNVTVVDELPAQLQYVPGSLRLGQRQLSDADDADEGRVTNSRIEVKLSQPVAPGEIIQLFFQATVAGGTAGGSGIVNTATISASNAQTVSTSEAVVVVDPFGTVYAARGGAGAPIAGARVSLLTDSTSGVLLDLISKQGFIPNEENLNPFLSNGNGRFGFVLTPEQFGTAQAPANYFINVAASNYRPRLLEISLRPLANGLFNMTVRSRDAMPLAVAGGFELITQDVELNGIANVALNVPMFENSSLEITKTADRAQAEIGDTVTYRVEVHNATAAPIYDAIVRDHLPESFQFAQGSGTLQKGSAQSASLTPTYEGDALTFQLGVLQAGERATLSYRVRIGVNAREGDQINTAVGTGRFATGENVSTPPAQATVRVGRGVFSTQQIIMGRVFEDANNNGQFDKGEKAVEGVRLFLSNGHSVVTDSQGMYNFPAVNEGAVVISLDPITLPRGYRLMNDGRRSDQSWTRLLRTPLGGGALLRQNFAVHLSDDNQSLAKASQSSSEIPVLDSLPSTNSSSGSKTEKVAVNTATQNADKRTVNNVKSAPVPSVPGTFEAVADETIAPVPDGEVLLLSPIKDEVILAPALSVEARVKESWSVELEVNNSRIPDSSIGTSRIDHKNNVATYSFVGINLKPGPNRVRVTAIGPNKERGHSVEMTVFGRGPAKRLEIVPEKKELQASGRDSVLVRVRALDEWGHPAADSQVAVETSAGRLVQIEDNATPSLALSGANINAPNRAVSEQVNTNTQQQVVSLVGGEVVITLVAGNTAGETKLHATLGNVKAEERVRFTPEVRAPIMVSLAEVSVGRAAPEIEASGTNQNVRAHVNLFYRGRFFGDNLLTLAYDSQRSLNRMNGRDRLFQLDPLNRAYPLFGDSSTRYEDANSNSKLYVRVDRRRSYAMFGDMEADMNESGFASYGRKLTGVKLHLENEAGDFLSLTGARPDTSFARDVFPGGTLSLVRLSYSNLLPGSENVVVEVRDRRNPEIILSRETLVRSVDYNLDSNSGTLLFLRPISTFDYQLNLVQIVVTYEHQVNGFESSVYTARAVKRFPSLGLRLGLSLVDQRQQETGTFMVNGLDGEWQTPGRGRLQFDWAMSRGRMAVNSSFGLNNSEDEHDGQAFHAALEQPLMVYEGRLRAEFQRTSANFFNPFGATATPGNTRGDVRLELKPLRRGLLSLGFTEERNRTENVNNSRTTMSMGWTQIISERLRVNLAYDYRRFNDEQGGRDVNSQMVTAGAEIRPTDKLELSVKHEQNLGEADPSYPTQTTISATYQLKPWAKLFLTQRLAADPITPISDTSLTGFAATTSRHETAIGIQSKLGRYTTLGGRYQLENGVNGTDSFAVIGLQNRLPINKELSLELGYERGFLIAGDDASFNNVTLGLSWLPTKNFRSNVRYELRDRNGLGQLLSLGAAGRLKDGITAMARLQFSRSMFSNRQNEVMDATAAVAIRPLESDRYGLLFSYRHRSLSQDGINGLAPTLQRADVLSSDGYYQLSKNLELYGRFAAKVSADGDARLVYVSTFTYMAQGRAQYRLGKFFDLAAEMRYMAQPASGTGSSSTGAEIGFWAMPDLRLGGGYNFSSAFEPRGSLLGNTRRGFYFTISSKLSSLFDLFGTSGNGQQAAPTEAVDKRNAAPEGQQK